MPETDSEIAAFTAIVTALEPLERVACRRVLRWADDRFVSTAVLDADADFLTKFVDGLRAAAAELGNTSPREIIAALSAVQEAKAASAD